MPVNPRVGVLLPLDSNSSSRACTNANSSTALTPWSRWAAVRGVPGDLEAEGEGAGVRGHDRVRGGLRDHAEVAAVASAQRRPGTEAAVLLADDAVQGHRPDQPHACRPDAASAASAAATPPFMSQAPRPWSAPSMMRGTNGSPSQSARSPGGTTRCAGQDQRRLPVLGAGQGADDAPRLGAFDLLARCVGRGGRLVQVDLPPVDVAAEIVEPAGQHVLHLALGGGAADRGDRDEPGQPVDHPRLVDGFQRPGLGVGQVGHGRSVARAADASGGRGR